ncbi:olfactory receptor 6N2-like [Pleurodeles waltl]|uniref:olfactory receptor 6N2-like n=1 Tax=Pleurodeles waltl TaxID=8319 RepID=UPI003709592C
MLFESSSDHDYETVSASEAEEELKDSGNEYSVREESSDEEATLCADERSVLEEDNDMPIVQQPGAERFPIGRPELWVAPNMEQPEFPAFTVQTGSDMEVMNNHSTLKSFIFQALSSHQMVKSILFFLFLMDYLLIITGNLAIIVVIHSNFHLRKPMYLLLSNLSFLEIWYTTSTIPNMLAGLLQDVRRISFAGCFIQFYFQFALGSTECFLLTLMGYDRLLAICKPLYYQKLMSSRVCMLLALSCWVAGFLWFLAPIALISQLPFCGPNKINHFLCDRGPLMSLSCKHDYLTEITFFAFATTMNVSTFLFILITYMYIIYTILRMSSAAGRQKAFSTCSSHLIVVSLFFGSVMFMYMRPAGHTFSQDKVVSLLYIAVTPLLNPLIYTLRNNEFKQALGKMLHQE